MKKVKKKNSWLRWTVIIILIGIIAVSLYNLGTIFYGYYIGTQEYKQVETLAGTEKDRFDGTVDFDALRKKNRDVEAWLYSEDTKINYPVMQSRDNQYYLYRMMNREYNGKGSLFIDYRCENPFEDFNTIIYGHRMKDGSMFYSLIKYREKEYFREHKKMKLITPDKKYNLYVFGVVTIPADSDKYKFHFSTQAEKQAYLDWIESNSETQTGVKATTDDQIVMLSTCTYEFDEARLIVYGKLAEIKER